MKLSVVIPARNEEGNIGPTLDAPSDHLQRHGIPYDLLVVDDGSSDGTATEVQRRANGDVRVRLIRNEGPHGFGFAVRCGLDAFRGDAVAVVMADGSDDPGDLVRYYEVLRDGAECAFGSRFIPGASVDGYPPFKRFVNRLVNRCLPLLFGYRYNDTTNAFKAYRANVIRGCQPYVSRHYNLTVELPLKAIVRGYSYRVIPVKWRQRSHGESGLRLKEMGSRYLFTVLYVWLEKVLTKGDYHR